MSSETKLEKTGAVFLDPKTCGSSIRWMVVLSRQEQHRPPSSASPATYYADLDFSLSQTDCSRSISWSVGSVGEFDVAKRKLVRAINEFRSALAAVKLAESLYLRMVKRGEVEQHD